MSTGLRVFNVCGIRNAGVFWKLIIFRIFTEAEGSLSSECGILFAIGGLGWDTRKLETWSFLTCQRKLDKRRCDASTSPI